MNQVFLLPAPALAPAHDAASLIARLALHSTIPAPELETLRELLAQRPPQLILAAIDQAHEEWIAEGGPDWPRSAADQDSYYLLLQGLRRLVQVRPFPAILAAA